VVKLRQRLKRKWSKMIRAATTQIPTKGSAIISFILTTIVASFLPVTNCRDYAMNDLFIFQPLRVNLGLGQGTVVLPFFP
jgi:hypothetical protein